MSAVRVSHGAVLFSVKNGLAPACKSGKSIVYSKSNMKKGWDIVVEHLVESLVNFFGTTIPAELTIFIVSLFPILELRGGMIAAALLGVPFGRAFLICFVGNMLPIPFILWLIRPVFNWLKGRKHLKRLADWMERKVEKNREKVLRYEVLGLLLFVAIPLPGTGGWTGSLVAALLDMPMKKTLPVITLGVLIAGIIMSIITYGLPALLTL